MTKGMTNAVLGYTHVEPEQNGCHFFVCLWDNVAMLHHAGGNRYVSRHGKRLQVRVSDPVILQTTDVISEVMFRGPLGPWNGWSPSVQQSVREQLK